MRQVILSTVYLISAFFLLTCRHNEPEPDPLLDGTPRLKSISFSGIRQENISIDQSTKIIMVKMPSILLDRVDVVVEPTNNAEWANKVDYLSAAIFGCTPCYQIIIKNKNEQNTILDRGIYTIQTVPSEPLKVALLSSPLTYTISTGDDDEPHGIDIPMVNLYGNKLPREARFTYTATGEVLLIKNGADATNNGVHYSSNSNRLSINLVDEKILPGSYQISLVLEDNTNLTVPQPLVVTKGSTVIIYAAQLYFGYRVATGKTFTMTGYNLFEGNIELELVDQQGKSQPLSNLIFDRYGQQLQVPVPTYMPPGQYILRVYLNSIKQPYCLRVNIFTDDKDRPILGTLVTKEPNDALPCSLFEPVFALKATSLFFTSNLEKQALDKLSQHASLKLLSTIDGTSYSANVVPYDQINSVFPGSFTIPNTVPSGLYTAILQVLDAQNKIINESEPYGRILNVQ